MAAKIPAHRPEDSDSAMPLVTFKLAQLSGFGSLVGILALTGCIASFMSTADSIVICGSMLFTIDFYWHTVSLNRLYLFASVSHPLTRLTLSMRFVALLLCLLYQLSHTSAPVLLTSSVWLPSGRSVFLSCFSSLLSLAHAFAHMLTEGSVFVAVAAR